MVQRRQFLTGIAAAMGAVTTDAGRLAANTIDDHPTKIAAKLHNCGQAPISFVDFRYSPKMCQHTFCYPEDPHKGVVGERGDLRYGRTIGGNQNGYVQDVTVGFSLNGFSSDAGLQQQLEGPGIPIIHTRIERAEAFLEMTAFASNEPEEGRVDNVIIEVRPRSKSEILACPLVNISTRRELAVHAGEQMSTVLLGGESGALLMVVDSLVDAANGQSHPNDSTAAGTLLCLKKGRASNPHPLRYFVRFPQEGQGLEKIRASMARPADLLAKTREYWQNWKPFHGEVSWRLPKPYSDFLLGCTSYLDQMRVTEMDRHIFLVGPTVYNTLAIVDGTFIMEAARYLGRDAEAYDSLARNWGFQRDDGGIFTTAGEWMWKDMGIACLCLARQAELSQSWDYFCEMQPRVLKALNFLSTLPDRARKEGGSPGRYGILPRGFADGGIGGVRPEFTNTVWALAGLKAANEAAAALKLDGFEPSRQFYNQLRKAFFAAAQQEMRHHPAGFDYLPMLMKEDPQWEAKDEWDRPRPQSGQWALSHAIYPGLVFDKQDPIVLGHMALMQACTQEDVPAETGWLVHEGLWGYNAPFVAQVYLWAGLADWADSTFHGFLNHASPLYAWVEEQPLQDSVATYPGGDMPHNWASAECIRYLRHMLALEDGPALRLLAGVGPNQLAAQEPYAIAGSPTRFGRVNLELQPHGDRWQLRFGRPLGPAPGSVHIPATMGEGRQLFRLSGANYRRNGDTILVEPSARAWTAEWA